MRTSLKLLVRLLLLVAAALCMQPSAVRAAGSPDVTLDPFGFPESAYSAWGIVDADYPHTGRVGCFPVGNGVIFATLGVDPDFNQLTSLTGPGYQTRDNAGGVVYWQAGNWPAMPVKLVRVRATGLPDPPYAFEEVQWEQQSIQQLRGAAMVRTIQRAGSLSLYCMTYAVPDTCILQRRFVLLGAGPDEVYGLSIDRSRAVHDEQGEQMQGDNRLITTANPPAYRHDRQGLTVIEGVNTAANGMAAVEFSVGYHVFKADQIYVPADDGGVGLGDAFLEHFSYYTDDELSPQACYTYWQEWSSHNLKFDTGRAELDDLMAQLPVTIETQRDAQSGGYSPMVNYHGYWVRDSLGPIYVNLLNQRFDVVQQMLTYHRKACWKLGRCSMLVPLDIDVSDVDEPVGQYDKNALITGSFRLKGAERNPISVNSEENWDAVPVEHAEVPSLIVLEHYWLWKCMHAAGQGAAADAFIAQAWPFITHNLFAMQFDPTYGVRFHGDETYTNGALYSTFDSGAPGELGYPNGYIPTEFFSFDNTLLHWSAAMAVREIADSLDSPVREDAQKLADSMLKCLGKYNGRWQWTLQGFGPAISPVTQQLWPKYFSNDSLAVHSLGLNYYDPASVPDFAYNWDNRERLNVNHLLGGQYDHAYKELHQSPTWKAAGQPLINWWTTPESGYTTGHALGTWLNAARYAIDFKSCTEIAAQLTAIAMPEGAWCEVYDPQGAPVNVYGRINRIRPWESGINYAMLAAWLSQQGQLNEQSGAGRAQSALHILTDNYPFDRQYREFIDRSIVYYDPAWFGYYGSAEGGWTWATPSAGTQLLVLTRDNHYRNLTKLDQRLAGLKPEQICAWDIGLPFTPADLRKALFPDHCLVCQPKLDIYNLPPAQACVPYLYLDRDVKLSDRRTFKTQKFWDELAPVLAEYQAAGGQVLDETSLQPSLADGEAVGLKVLLVLYPRTFCWEMDAEAIANFHKETAKWISWYDQVAGDKLKLQLDFLQIDRRLPPRACGPQGSNVYWMGYDGVEADLLARGIERGKYDSVCCFWAWDRETPSLPDGAPAAQAYGGAAQGPGSDMAFLGDAGRTSYYGAAVLKSHFVTTGRVALHEFLHNLDAMFGVAGMDDEFFSSDDMEAHMPLLLKERPGVFAQYGYDDAAMLDLAEKSRTGEAGFPWRTQLEYYRWCLERTPGSDYAKLLKRFGQRVPASPRVALYDSFMLPRGVQPYQILFDSGATVPGRDSSSVARAALPADDVGGHGGPLHGETGTAARPTGFVPITIEDVDADGYVHWRSEAYGGVLSEPWPQPVSFYSEAELVAPDQQQVLLGRDTAQLRVELRDSVSRQALPEASVKADIAGQTIALTDAGSGSYTAALPAGLEQDTDVAYTAQLPGYTISEHLCSLLVKPVWTADVQFRYSETDLPTSEAPFNPGIRVTLDGPPGAYQGTLKFAPELNTVQQLLADAGLITLAQPLEAEFNTGPGGVIYLGLDRNTWESLQYFPGTLRIDYTLPGDGLPLGMPTTSFTQRIAPTFPMSNLLGGIDPARLPAYIPRARHMTPVLDGKLGEWGMPPSLSLDQAGGHGFGPGFKSAGDGAVQLWLAYDDSMLYVAGTVADDMLKSGDMWSSDRLNLVFDMLLDTTRATYPQGAVGHTGWTRDDYWVLLCPFVRGPEGKPQPLTERLGGQLPGGSKTGYFGDLAGAEVQVAQDDGGYSFEWALPLASLPHLTPKPGGFVGFTFFLSDHDAELNELMYLNNWWTPSGIEWRYWDCGLLYFEP